MQLAGKKGTVYFDGAWIVKTQGSGHDHVYGAWAVQLNAQNHQDQRDLGDRNDRGGPGQQEVVKWDLFPFTMDPGDAFTLVFGIFGHSKGGVNVGQILSDAAKFIGAIGSLIKAAGGGGGANKGKFQDMGTAGGCKCWANS